MNLRIYMFMIVLLSVLVFAILITGCDRLKKAEPRAVVEQPTNKQYVQTSNVQTSTPPVKVKPEVEDIEKKDAERRASLPRQEYGRNNPFARLLGASPAKKDTNVSKVVINKPVTPPTVRTEVKNTEKEVAINLNAILGSVAILQVDGSNRSVSVGDSVAGLKVTDIGEGRVVLERGNEKFPVGMEAGIKVKAK